jgi:hypothetical protein
MKENAAFIPGPARESGVLSKEPITANILPGIVVLALVALAITMLPQKAVATETVTKVSSKSAPAIRHTPVRIPKGSAGEPAIISSHAHLGNAKLSGDARDIGDWVVDSSDNRGLSFIIVDKKNAMVHLFDATGQLQASAPALLGMARGDHSVPGIGDREYADMPPETRTTPAGRFVAEMGINARGEDIVWVDYDAAVSLHRVVTSNAKERRLQRLATPTPLDNRISYGCINVPVQFYEKAVKPAFTSMGGIVYVLPEIRTAHEVFASYNVEERRRSQAALQTTREPGSEVVSTTGQQFILETQPETSGSLISSPRTELLGPVDTH